MIFEFVKTTGDMDMDMGCDRGRLKLKAAVKQHAEDVSRYKTPQETEMKEEKQPRRLG